MMVVSIHAPAWGATPRMTPFAEILRVSIHAPAWGATHALDDLGIRQTGFNPRTRVGCDSVMRWHP